MTRLRVGHCNLNKTLHIIGKHPTGLCDFCQLPESVKHVLCICKKYEADRQVMLTEMEKLGLTGSNLDKVLIQAEKEQSHQFFI